MSSQKRPYELKERAERQEQTRQRIVEATVALHEEVGPAQTTIAEIARRAGVQRLTVYKHFPGEVDLFAACSGRYLEDHPFPDLSDALGLQDPRERVRAVLGSLYGRYRETERMTANVLRDRLLLPAIDERVAVTVDAPLAEVTRVLEAGFEARGKRADRIRALIATALDFWTWRRLKQQRLDDAAAATLMADAVACIAKPLSSRPSPP